ncbi:MULTISPECIES: helix-turn-helix domain-containing protein [unclassified Crossiella]|uniref:PucR family transcriptional regulator n=1 Tax=unclassified Crossiella TaxID=2620835 RepID=UPI001FFF02E2|nr:MULTISPECIES: helix-turn-helix domain-containing protein [unclassified Crossiella]MCK2244814.1 helix-turn-helix domain-containing protein [Crossiella sp. S99.2]MCK2258456.1 helix-turn-helix domain-containing protein [Crossiella sp. S99.1]
MPDDKPRDLVVGGEALHERFTRQLPALVERVLVEITRRVPAYRQLPAEALAGDINQVIESTLRSFIDILRTRTLPTRGELGFLRESAARRAEEGLPIDVVLTAYHIGVQVLWDSLRPDARPEEIEDVMTVNDLALRYLEVVAPAVGAGYLDARQTMFDDDHSARHTLLSSLLSGIPAEVAAGQAGLRLPPCYLVLALAVGAHPDETGDGVDPVIAGRRKLRRVRAELDRQIRDPVLSTLTAEGGTALLPGPAPVAELTERDWAWLDRVVAGLSRAAGAEITVGAVAAEPAGVAEAATVAGEVLAVARRFGRPPGVHRLRDVLLEYQLSRPSPALDQLAGVLEPLSGNEELVQTLEVFLRAGGRRAAASELHVHPNTVDYRLRRIAELTGLDATSTKDVGLLKAALAARAATRR